MAEHFVDHMSRGVCRKQKHKCPVGKGFYSPGINSLWNSNVSCISCPKNCMSCHVTISGSDYLCYEKWPANGYPFTPVAGSYNIPTCGVNNCDVCERTPCDLCNPGWVLVISDPTGTPNILTDYNSKRHTCFSGTTCPTGTFTVKSHG